jgi:methylated-DNA-[protein]-cysteine S-methyltransferase
MHRTGKKMQKVIKYTVFKTKWGYFGLAGTDSALLRTHLPEPGPEIIKAHFLKDFPLAKYDRTFFSNVQAQIKAYFEGNRVNFGPDVTIALENFSRFYRTVLSACRKIGFGKTSSYSLLAKKSGSPAASRAVGNALAKNPMPLIIPCHRVVRGDGKLGGFSATGGIDLKARLLRLEQQSA